MNKILFFLIVMISTVLAGSKIHAQKIMPVKVPLAAPKVVNFAERVRYEKEHPAIRKNQITLKAEDKDKKLRFKPQSIPANAIKFNIPHRRIPGGIDTKKVESLMSPPPSISFNGIMDNHHNPADLNGAAGINHLMETTNGAFSVYTKTGTLLSTVTPPAFFSLYAPSALTDPHIIYDIANRRYIIVMIGVSNLSGQGGAFLAVSQTADPTGDWFTYFHHIQTSDTTFTLDYPLLGYNTNWVVVTISASRVYVFNRASLYSGTIDTVNTFISPSLGTAFLGPALTYDTSQTTEYLVENMNGNSGGSGYVRISTITGTPDAPVFATGSTIGISRTWNDGSFQVPQNGGTETLDGGDSRINNSIYINNALWFCHAVALPASVPTHSAIDWWQLDPMTPSIRQFGRVEDTTGANFYFYPSLAVNAHGDAVLGYCQSSHGMFASAAYSIHALTDPTDTMESSNLYKPGLGYYNITTMTDPRNRWGDFTGMAVDPVDGSFWNFGLFADTVNKWGTVVAHIIVPPSADLYSKDVIADNGTEPNPSLQPMYQSEDIWLRQSEDLTHTFAHITEPARHPGNNYVYVAVHNRGNAASSGTEHLTLYWAKAGSALSWPMSWNGGSFFDPGHTMLMGAPIGTQTIPAIPAGDSAILVFPWVVSDPAIYTLPIFTGDLNHFCLLSRITLGDVAPYGMTFPETSDLYQNVQYNNNIVWKNIEVFEVGTHGLMASASAIVGNLTDAKMKVKFRFNTVDANGAEGFLAKGKLVVTAKGKLIDYFKQNRISGNGIKETGQGTFEVTKDGAELDNIYLEPKEMGAFEMKFVPNNANDSLKGFAINFTQIEDLNGTDHIIGGQTFVFGQVKGFGTSMAGTTDGANSKWHWWYIILILAGLLILLNAMRRKK